MDFDEYWQENKGFVGVVLAGLAVFVIARMVIAGTLGEDVNAARRTLNGAEQKLRTAMYDADARDAAQTANAGLQEVRGRLEAGAAFVPREGFDLEGAISPSSRYHRVLADLRDGLLPEAGRANLVLDRDLGQPDLSPTREEEIVRYLEAMDLVERVVRLGLDLGLERIEDVQVTLDPALRGKEGVGTVERTRVRFELGGSGAALLELLRRSQQPDRVLGGQALALGPVDVRPAKRTDDSEATVSFYVVRLAELATDDDDQEDR